MKICVVTGSRADYGLLYWLMHDIRADVDCRLQLAVTGMHLSPEFGQTWRVIEEDGFDIDARVETLISSDTPVGVAKSVGLGVIGFADAYQRLRPDVVLLLGDRYEIFAAAQAAYLARIPIAHIAGGDVTEGAFDEAIRHGITKMAQMHFVTNPEAARRVRQLGEAPERVFEVGSPGIDAIRRIRLLNRIELENTLDVQFKRCNFLVTFHPVTLASQPAEVQLEALLQAVETFLDGDTHIVFTRPNADTGGRAIIRRLDEFAATHVDTSVFTSLGQQRYLSLVALVDVVVGNSSSGLYEVPSLKRPTVNVGDRQKGRLAAASVLHCPAETAAIVESIRQALTLDCTQVANPYGDGDASRRILVELKRMPPADQLLMKHFHDL